MIAYNYDPTFLDACQVSGECCCDERYKQNILFRTEVTIYCEILQCMKSTSKQLNTPAWHWRHADKLWRRRADYQESAASPTKCRWRRRSDRRRALTCID